MPLWIPNRENKDHLSISFWNHAGSSWGIETILCREILEPRSEIAVQELIFAIERRHLILEM